MLYIIYNYIHVSYLALKKSQQLIINSLVFFYIMNDLLSYAAFRN